MGPAISRLKRAGIGHKKASVDAVQAMTGASQRGPALEIRSIDPRLPRTRSGSAILGTRCPVSNRARDESKERLPHARIQPASLESKDAIRERKKQCPPPLRHRNVSFSASPGRAAPSTLTAS